MPCHHTLERFLDAYIDAAGIAHDAAGPLFRSVGRKTGRGEALWQQDAYRMIARRRRRRPSRPRSAITPSARPALPPTSKTRARWSTRRRSPTIPRRARQSSMTGGAMRFRSMRLRKSQFE